MKAFKQYKKNNKPKTFGYETQGDYYYGGMEQGWRAALEWINNYDYRGDETPFEIIEEELNV